MIQEKRYSNDTVEFDGVRNKMKTVIKRIQQKMKDKNIEGNPVTSLEYVKRFELENNIKLPEELVLFYTEVCNGCRMLDGFNLLRMEDWKYDLNHLTKDFLFEEFWIWEDDYDAQKMNCITDGNLELIDIGDAQTWNIIIKGKERGKMWFFTDVGIQPCAPSMSFLEWFEFWLDGNEDYFYGFNNGE